MFILLHGSTCSNFLDFYGDAIMDIFPKKNSISELVPLTNLYGWQWEIKNHDLLKPVHDGWVNPRNFYPFPNNHGCPVNTPAICIYNVHIHRIYLTSVLRVH